MTGIHMVMVLDPEEKITVKRNISRLTITNADNVWEVPLEDLGIDWERIHELEMEVAYLEERLAEIDDLAHAKKVVRQEVSTRLRHRRGGPSNPDIQKLGSAPPVVAKG